MVNNLQNNIRIVLFDTDYVSLPLCYFTELSEGAVLFAQKY